ncbi:TraB/GumN family protein [Aestuariibius sp. 2305UL40-4]|uniref:TraB/GumN family protein n=1 Tax=Aestuariibius violaceus TaxID=3234132 RepID=UPI00345EBD22
MIRTLFALFLALGLSQAAAARCTGTGYYESLSAQDQAAINAATAATPYGTGRVWEARQGGTTITLIGTMHLPDRRHRTLLNALSDRLATAELLLLEADAAEEARLQQALASDPRLLLIPGPSLPERLPEDEWQRLSRHMSDRNILPAMGSRFQPWFLSLMLSVPPCAMPGFLSGQGGLDKRLEQQATERSIPTASLERFDTVFNLFNTIPLDEQIEQLMISLIDEDIARAQHVSMVDAYFDGETARIWETSKRAARTLPNLSAAEIEALLDQTEDLLITRRNEAWIPVIENAARGRRHIAVAAGALHLPGEQGVLNLLARRGWTITSLAR